MTKRISSAGSSGSSYDITGSGDRYETLLEALEHEQTRAASDRVLEDAALRLTMYVQVQRLKAFREENDRVTLTYRSDLPLSEFVGGGTDVVDVNQLP